MTGDLVDDAYRLIIESLTDVHDRDPAIVWRRWQRAPEHVRYAAWLALMCQHEPGRTTERTLRKRVDKVTGFGGDAA